MAVLKLSSHTLYVSINSNGYEDENGDWHEGKSVSTELCKCDVVPAGKANERVFEDGVKDTYSYIIYLPKDCQRIEKGAKVSVKFADGVVREFLVKGFHRYQLQCKMWV